MPTDLHVEAPDKPGALAEIGRALGNAAINLAGGCATTGGGVGHLHLLVKDADKATEVIEKAGFTVTGRSEPIIITDVDDVPGFLGQIAWTVAEAGVNIEAFYVGTDTRIVLICSDPAAARAALGL
jgi:hypothetical protein